MAAKSLYMIGYNRDGQLGTGDAVDVKKLKLIPNKEIQRIFPGLSQTIFANNDLSKYMDVVIIHTIR